MRAHERRQSASGPRTVEASEAADIAASAEATAAATPTLSITRDDWAAALRRVVETGQEDIAFSSISDEGRRREVYAERIDIECDRLLRAAGAAPGTTVPALADQLMPAVDAMRADGTLL